MKEVSGNPNNILSENELKKFVKNTELKFI